MIHWHAHHLCHESHYCLLHCKMRTPKVDRRPLLVVYQFNSPPRTLLRVRQVTATLTGHCFSDNRSSITSKAVGSWLHWYVAPECKPKVEGAPFLAAVRRVCLTSLVLQRSKMRPGEPQTGRWWYVIAIFLRVTPFDRLHAAPSERRDRNSVYMTLTCLRTRSLKLCVKPPGMMTYECWNAMDNDIWDLAINMFIELPARHNVSRNWGMEHCIDLPADVQVWTASTIRLYRGFM